MNLIIDRTEITVALFDISGKNVQCEKTKKFEIENSTDQKLSDDTFVKEVKQKNGEKCEFE